VALLTCVFVGWVIKPQTLVDEIAQSSPFRLRRAWAAMVRYVAPVLLAVILVAYVAAQFGLFSM
jgi:NSS family neurotransmitter:Na+ symporter